MPYVLLTALLFALAWAPSLWVRHQMRRHGKDRPDLPGTGSELAVHLLRRFGLDDVGVERTGALKDHYDPKARMVRLGPDNHDGRSLTAVAVAAHEVGHAIQFGRDEPVSRLRRKWLPVAHALKRAGVLVIVAMPVLGLLARSPAAIAALIALSLVLQLAGALAYAVILPEEWDASFGKALPVLADGDYVPEADLPAVRRVLQAAALTYAARALADLVNIGRWAMILRR